MPIKIGGKSAAVPNTSTETEDTSQTPDTIAPEGSPAPAAGVVTFGPQAAANFLKTGDTQKNAIDQVKAQQQLRERLRGGAREFWLDPGQFARLYFLDGKLLSPGVFDTPMVATHLLQIGGDYVSFICNKDVEGQCLVCDSNADRTRVTTLQLFSVINTMPYKIQRGKNQGKVLPARLQLLAVTMKSRDILEKRAANRGGMLAGNMFNFSRSTQQDPRTGNDVEWLQSVDMQSVLKKYPKLGDDDAPTAPINYAKAYPVLTNSELAALRPDLASMAGWTGNVDHGVGGYVAGTTSSVGDLGDDEVPF